MGPVSFVSKCLDGTGRVLRILRLHLARMRAASQTDRPNTAEEWAALYDSTTRPIRVLASEVARTVADLTSAGDVLLEAGCGSGVLSAELAIAGRVIELADFSQEILDRAARLFELSGLPRPKTTLADLTKPLPWTDNAVDTVWSSGVLEHWTDDELRPIIAEMARISRKSVISLVPNSRSIWYRFGKHLAEQAGLWAYGRELPRDSQRKLFAEAGLVNIREFTVWLEPVTDFVRTTDPHFAALARRWWNSLPPDDPAKLDQGYLLVTIGSKRA
ncbi:MAG: class I SAM-dependent methyltransferase [Tepidisphaeraceae bacterium]|jgi:SAM-dependent methyltransferase